MRHDNALERTGAYPYIKGMYYTLLSDRKLIEISGEDTQAFLQGLISNDVSRLSQRMAMYASLLTPQGRFLHDFFLLPRRDAILLDCNREALADLLPRLAMYKLRSKVVIKEKESLGVVALWGDRRPDTRDQEAKFDIFPDPRVAKLGWRVVGDVAAITAWCERNRLNPATPEDYEELRLTLGVPDGARDMTRDKSLLLEFGFEDLHGVDFKKGCYVGQEVTARSKYRGQVRRFIYQVRADQPLPPAGTPVVSGDVPIGELRSVKGNVGLALLQVAEVEKAQDFYAAGVALKAMLPQWVMHPPKALVVSE